MQIIANIRCLKTKTTGVQRYTRHILAHMPHEPHLIAPTTYTAGVKGHLWEQWVLPKKLAGALLWSPANTGPINIRRQVVTIHDLSIFEHPEWFSQRFAKWYQLMTSRLAGRCLHILTVSKYSADSLMRILNVPAGKITVTPCGPSLVGNRPAAVQQQSLLDDLTRQRFCLAVSSIAPHKNQQRLLQAWGQVAHKLPDDIWLYIVGSATTVHKRYLLDRLPPRVKLLGYIDDDLLQQLYSKAYAFIHPSLFEGFGIPVLDALVHGIPSVVSHAGSLPEITADSAIMIDPTATGDLANAIERVCCDDVLRRECHAKAIEQAKLFSWQASAVKTAEVLDYYARA